MDIKIIFLKVKSERELDYWKRKKDINFIFLQDYFLEGEIGKGRLLEEERRH